MERLTERSRGPLPVLVRGKALGPAYFMSEYEDYRDALNRLAAYEDTGLEPEEILGIIDAQAGVSGKVMTLFGKPFSYWMDLLKAEEQGLLVRLPCKVGDTVYIIIGGRIFEGKVYHISYSNYSGKVTSYVVTEHGACASFDHFGKTAFLTREEAQAALEKERERRR